MTHQRFSLVALFCATLFASPALLAINESQLPDIGTAGVSALTIDREIAYGESFMRFARAQLPIIDDPVLDEYLDDLGQRLVSHAENVRFPFTFFLIHDDTINAAAFLGGKVKVHFGLFLNAENENELAGVLAHEISHITQRHIARYMESQTKQTPVAIAGLVGSIALAIINPSVGVAAMQTMLGINVQTAISYTRDNEFEADRIGMKLLYEAGFDPMGMVTFFQKLAATSRYASKPPEMLLTHPLPETRISEARNRAANYPKVRKHDDLNFSFAKARIQVRYSNETADGMLGWFDKELVRNPQQAGLLYGKALALLALKRQAEAEPIIQQLANRYPDNPFILDTQTDIDMANNQVPRAVQRLESWLQRQPDNEVVIFNLVSALQQQSQYARAIKILDLYVRNHPDNVLGWSTLADLYRQTSDQTNLHIAWGEHQALLGDYPHAIDELTQARATTQDRLTLARLDARLVQFEEAKRQDESLRQ